MIKNFRISADEIALIRFSIEEKLNALNKTYMQQPDCRDELDQEMDAYEKLLKRLRTMELNK